MAIKNVVFDIGNVLVTWDPSGIVARFFPEHPEHAALTQAIFKSKTWLDLNKGFITETQAIAHYNKLMPEIEKIQFEKLMVYVKESLTPVQGSFELLDNLYQSQIPLYSITDNVKEIVDYLKIKYDFWGKFKDVVVSADIGYLKPAQEIYLHLLQRNKLIPSETLFIDDYLSNVEGAQKVGMQAFQFTDAIACAAKLKNEFALKWTSINHLNN